MSGTVDLVVRGGLVVDGLGAEPYVADVAVDGDRIVAIGTVAAKGRTEIDATGKLVTPGFVDVHTHYDGQAIWSPRMSPSSSHGVTTVVLGNCGVGFAPCRKGDHDALISLMEGVEDIPEVVMAHGLTWDWETFPEYMDALDRRPRDIDIGAYLPHSPLRVYVMGDRALAREPANDDDIKRMSDLAREAARAGALGFATSRLAIHRSGAGEHIPSYEAARAELIAIGSAMRETGGGVMQIVPNTEPESYPDEIRMMGELSEATGLPVTFSLAEFHSSPGLWRKALDIVHDSNCKDGVSVSAQIFPRPVGMILGLETSVHPFSLCPSYAQIADLPLDERVAAMRDPAMRERLLNEKPGTSAVPLFQLARDFGRIFAMGENVEYEPAKTANVAAIAEAKAVPPEEVAYDLLLEQDGHALLYAPLANYAHGNLDTTLEMIRHPNTILGLGDGGAHYGVICDASFPTFVMTHWTRGRSGTRLGIAEAVKQLSHDPAKALGLNDRGVLAVGRKADINVIDYDALGIENPHIVRDLPGGGKRLTQGARGYVATIVSGVPIVRDDEPTGALPGRLVRGGAARGAELAAA